MQVICTELQSNLRHQLANIQTFYKPAALPAARCQSTEAKSGKWMLKQFCVRLTLFTGSAVAVFCQ